MKQIEVLEKKPTKFARRRINISRLKQHVETPYFDIGAFRLKKFTDNLSQFICICELSHGGQLWSCKFLRMST